jgi:hypothetical protein
MKKIALKLLTILRTVLERTLEALIFSYPWESVSLILSLVSASYRNFVGTIVLTAALLISVTPIEQALAVDYSQLVPTPAPSELNPGLTSPPASYMKSVLGVPGALTTDCSPVTNSKLKNSIVTQNVGPFRVTGYKPAVEAVKRIFAQVKRDDPELYSQLGTAGMLCVRKVRGGSNFSNHSWGTAIDIRINGKLDGVGDGKTQIGLKKLYPYFHKEGFYWGAAYSGRREDSMHFEASKEQIQRWLNTLSTPPYQKWLLRTGTPQHETGSNWQFVAGDYNGDGKTDIIGLKKSGTGTKSTEVHILDGASNYQKWLLHTGTPQHETGSNWQFVADDYNSDGKTDIIGLKKSGTGTKSTEVHILG